MSKRSAESRKDAAVRLVHDHTTMKFRKRHSLLATNMTVLLRPNEPDGTHMLPMDLISIDDKKILQFFAVYLGRFDPDGMEHEWIIMPQHGYDPLLPYHDPMKMLDDADSFVEHELTPFLKETFSIGSPISGLERFRHEIQRTPSHGHLVVGYTNPLNKSEFFYVVVVDPEHWAVTTMPYSRLIHWF